MVLTNDKIRLHGEYAMRSLFYLTTNGKQQVHFRSFIFHMSGHCKMMNVNKNVHEANKIALPFDSIRAAAMFLPPWNLLIKLSYCMCTREHTGMRACVCLLCFCECMHFVFVLAPAPARFLSGLMGGGQRERSLIKTDRSNTLAFPGWRNSWELRVPQPRSLSDQSTN